MAVERLRRTAANAREVLRRVVERRGYERETVVIIAKCVIASTGAWVVGALMVDSSQVGFAPFSALLVVRPSVYGSVLQSLRYVPAVFLGALIAGLTGLTVGLNVWFFALAVLLAMVAGQFTVFGDQGKQIPVVASFALAGGTAGSPVDLGTLLLMVLVGAGAAVVTNTVLAPAIRFRDAESAVFDFADGLRDLCREMSEALREGSEGLGDASYWARVAQGFDNTERNARESVSQQEYRARLNPRRLLAAPSPKRAPKAYYGWILALGRSSRHLQSLIRTLRAANNGRSRFPEPSDVFLREFAPLLDAAADALAAVHEAGEPERDTVSADLDSCLEGGLRRIDRARERMSEDWDSERWPVHSALLTDLERMLEELWEGHENSTEGASGGAAG
ncbi:FUSC family protein [Nocardiopsis deserti]|uniref:FUSC family protein n=1 Tax=Nocardiopsis deserti TaxID=2605988 RepID=UPI001238500D|nr:aromatic acid exporter family protein [Nocardiopsis deserti]